MANQRNSTRPARRSRAGNAAPSVGARTIYLLTIAIRTTAGVPSPLHHAYDSRERAYEEARRLMVNAYCEARDVTEWYGGLDSLLSDPAIPIGRIIRYWNAEAARRARGDADAARIAAIAIEAIVYWPG